ncbi:thioredoxin-disulfide reductase [Granulicatella sp. zg-ZJ]|uniref:thioredoxin-disulfide reductase n=1 Tax=unclassified Granulicatella TaxID=2630493 RepID=UPI0013C244C3|nr:MULTISPECIES: thioredoxin-disulfide reductase [unclassified Granulicatella]NEW62570.1 thioredoxin-disulfide reductase [Granulicatella sp. zg-ZJ]NEW66119.1 thioredoxin-disulfide reductase [Granulicatella sp. zg-84]QMI85440.1 thioredoxin-disulfide reductase [Carnobacteriaceae bacterium zg-84]
MDKIFDVIIIGAGPGGMTAALYASRANLSVLMLERGVPGGEMLNTSEIENYPGYVSILGPDLANKMYESAMHFGAEYAYGDVTDITLEEDIKVVHAGKKTYRAYAIIIATGSHHRLLGVDGESQYSGRGVSYCAVCDGAFFKDKELIVVGGGDSAVEEGTYLTQFASKVSIVHRRDALRAQKILQDRAFKNDKITFIWDSVVEEILGEDNAVSGVRLKNVKTNEVSTVSAAGVFIYVGLLPNTEAFKNLGITDDEGWILTNDQMETVIPGVFAIGDVRQKTLRQVATAVGDGAQAGQGVYHFIETLKEKQAQ